MTVPVTGEMAGDAGDARRAVDRFTEALADALDGADGPPGVDEIPAAPPPLSVWRRVRGRRSR